VLYDRVSWKFDAVLGLLGCRCQPKSGGVQWELIVDGIHATAKSARSSSLYDITINQAALEENSNLTIPLSTRTIDTASRIITDGDHRVTMVMEGGSKIRDCILENITSQILVSESTIIFKHVCS
jgi:hypothetical protein